MIKVELTREQHKNLIEFLLRVNMTGREAIPFMDLLGIINQSALGLKEEPKLEKEPKKNRVYKK